MESIYARISTLAIGFILVEDIEEMELLLSIQNLIDQLNAFHSEQKQLIPNDFTRSVDSIHYYDSVLVVHKKESSPKNITSGEISFEKRRIVNYKANKKPYVDNKLLILINKILRYFKFRSIIWK